mgnify:CR=1 FL=1
MVRQEFVNALTTNLTAFFREQHHFEIFATHLRSRPASTPWRVWCNAASTGEENYSIVMTALETLGANASFQGGHALLQHRVGRVADAAVHMAAALQVEEGRCVVARLKDERGRQVDGGGACAGGGVGAGACVQRQRVKAGV